jgi:hypothetical protein
MAWEKVTDKAYRRNKMKVDLTLRDAQILMRLLSNHIESNGRTNDENYPGRSADKKLVQKLDTPSDPFWNLD